MSQFVDISQQAPLTPTLVIGLGGTGVQVVRRVKGSLQQYFADRNLGTVPPIMRFLAIDSVPLTNPTGETELDRNEYVYLGQVDGGLVVSNPRFHPEIASWWDGDRNAPGHIDNGCGQMRDVGRLVFFYHYNDFLARLSNQLNLIQQQANVFEAEFRGFTLRPNQLRICVVSSVAGGTGSGIVLDATYNLHHLVSRMRGVTASVEGYLVLPDVYLDSLPSVAMKASVQANGYAALTELEFLNRSPERASEFFHKYPDGHTINPQRRPFDHTFLVGARDQQGFGLSSPEQAYDAIAESIYLESVYLDQAMTENTANVFADTDVGGDIGKTGMGRYYSSFSVSAVSVRRDLALDYLRHRLTLDALHDLLRADTTAETDVQAPPDELQAGTLVDSTSERLAAVRPRPDLIDRHEAESKPLLDVLDRNDAALHVWLNDSLQPLQESARKRQRDLRTYVDRQAWTIALEQGIDAVFPYLQGWMHRLQLTSEALRDRAGNLDQRSDELHRTYEHDRAELDELALGPGLHILVFDGTAKRRHRREQLFDDARKSLASYYEARMEREVVRQLHSSVVHTLLGDTVEDNSGSITRSIKQWESVRDVFRAVETDVERGMGDRLAQVERLEAGHRTYAVAHPISMSRTDLDALYAEIQSTFGKADFLQWMAKTVREADPDGIEAPRHLQDELRAALLGHAREMCLTIFAGPNSRDAAITRAHGLVETALSRCLGTYISRPAVLNELFEYNVPFWSYSSVTKMENVLERTNLVAVESRSPEGWQSTDPENVLSLGRGQERLEHGVEADRIVETGDPSVLAVYRASYGLPLFLLNEIPDLREQYTRRRGFNREANGKKGGLSLHLCRQWNDQAPVDLALDSMGEQALTGLGNPDIKS
jgi:Tubulin like